MNTEKGLKMKNITLILISLLFLTGISEAKEVTSLQDRGGVRYEDNSETPFTGKLVKKYENGQKKYEANYTDGMKNGPSTWWSKNGQKLVEENYKGGKIDGVRTDWYDLGQKKYEGTYKNVKKEGRHTWWYENGQKKYESIYKNDKKEGLYTQWNENGQKQSEENYKDGKKEGLETTWNSDGLKSEVNYKDGKVDGIVTLRDESGLKQGKENYKDGEVVSDENQEALFPIMDMTASDKIKLTVPNKDYKFNYDSLPWGDSINEFITRLAAEEDVMPSGAQAGWLVDIWRYRATPGFRFRETEECAPFMGTNRQYDVCMDIKFLVYENVYKRELACIGFYGNEYDVKDAKEFDKSWRSYFNSSSSYIHRSNSMPGRHVGLSSRDQNIYRWTKAIEYLREGCESVNGRLRFDFETLLFETFNKNDIEGSMDVIRNDLMKFHYFAPLPKEVQSFYGETLDYTIHIYLDIDGKFILNLWDVTPPITQNSYDMSPNVVVSGSISRNGFTFTNGDINYKVTKEDEGRELIVSKGNEIILKQKILSYKLF